MICVFCPFAFSEIKFAFVEVFIMTKKVSRIIATIMLVIAVGFVGYALSHPEASFPWSNVITFGIFIVYLVAMIILFVASFKKS